MTFKEKAIQLLVNSGMFESDAAKVFEQVESAPENKSMQGRWNDDVEGYPLSMQSVLRVSVKHHAAKWIAEHQPEAWYRSVFEEAAV